MPIKVVLQTIDAKRFDEAIAPNAVLNRLLPFNDASFPVLRFIDRYGDTIFNGNQMHGLLPEWDLLVQKVTDKQESEFMLKVRAMAEKCKAEPHLFLRFLGD
jgi:hypothetical protein